MQTKVLSFRDHLQTILNNRDFSSEYASFLLPSEEKILSDSIKLADKLSDFQNIAIIGIGGSNLGTVAIYDALRKHIPNKGVYFFDTTDTEYTLTTLLDAVEKKLIAGEKLILTVISKSGTTTESIALASTIYNIFIAKYKNQIEIVTISDFNSKLDLLAEEEWWKRLHIQKMVGGRYSVFTNVGIFPLTFMGIDTKELVRGAQKAIDDFLIDPENHQSTNVALGLYNEFPKRNLFQHWFFSKKLENLGKWYRQLLAESIGKEKADGTSVGITPTVAIGTIDLHSVAQLEIAHSDDRSIAIVEETETDEHIIRESPFMNILPDIRGKSFGKIMRSGAEGFRSALITRKVPVYSYELSTDTPYDIGYWLQGKMLEVALLGYLFDINPFDQPNVEEYKTGMRRFLENE
ncbi:hypothetical protein KBB25_03695 [Candidatus Gracilibacteria bacterium]|nr:hypothetical protein [Candidatus Gracilibacteria bacterium]